MLAARGIELGVGIYLCHLSFRLERIKVNTLKLLKQLTVLQKPGWRGSPKGEVSYCRKKGELLQEGR